MRGIKFLHSGVKRARRAHGDEGGSSWCDAVAGHRDRLVQSGHGVFAGLLRPLRRFLRALLRLRRDDALLGTTASGARSGTRVPRALELLVQGFEGFLGVLELLARRELNVRFDVGADAFGGRVDGLRNNT